MTFDYVGEYKCKTTMNKKRHIHEYVSFFVLYMENYFEQT